MSDVSPLVSADWLAQHLRDPDLLPVDIRSAAIDGGGEAAYLAAHVPGAVHTDYARGGWRAVKGMASGLLPEPAVLAKLLGGLGLTPAHHAVIISAGASVNDFSSAARVYWTLKVAGHDKVSLLDGGMAAWQGRPVESGLHAAKPAPDYPVKLRADLRSGVASIEAAIANGSEVMLDARSEGYFAGREKSPQARRAGRLPGALHLDHRQVYDNATNRLKSEAELAGLFAGVPDKPVVSFCNTGHQAAPNWFVLSEILHRPATLYDGSMSEWTEDDKRPVDVG